MTDECHVALVTPWNRQGGVADYSKRFARALEETGIRVTPVPIKHPNSANPLAFLDLLEEVPASADVIHVQFEAGLFGSLGMSGIGAPAFFLALGRADPCVAVTLHEVHAEHGYRGTVGDYLLRSRDALIERLALRAADVTFVHTAEARRVLRARHGDRWRIERLLHPTDATAEPIPAREAKATLGLEGPVALTFGYVEAKKRYEDVIRALPSFPDLTYVIAGGLREGEGEAVMESCRDLTSDLGVADRIEYLGYVADDDVPAVFSSADVVVLPYERVTQSGVVNEALAYRRPVVASSLPAFEELREEFGCLRTYQTPEELDRVLSELLSNVNEREQLRTKARDYTETVTWEWFASSTAELYRDIR